MRVSKPFYRWVWRAMFAWCLIMLAMLGAQLAHATEYPSRAVRIIVPYPPAGGTDILSRYLFAKVQKATGWDVVVENMGGATGVIGARFVSMQKPDGYVLLMGHIAPNAINPGDFLDPKQPVDWRLDPVAMGAIAPTLLLVRSELGITTLKDLRAYLKKQDTPLYGSDGVGSLAHLQMEMLLDGQRGRHAAYRGGGPALMALLSRDFDVLFSPAPVAMGHIGSDKFKVIAQTSPFRIAAFPTLPTMREAGYPLLDAPLWWGLFAPAGTPRDVVRKWNDAVNAALRDPDTQAWMTKMGYSAMPMTVAEFAKYVHDDEARWAKVARAIHDRPQ